MSASSAAGLHIVYHSLDPLRRRVGLTSEHQLNTPRPRVCVYAYASTDQQTCLALHRVRGFAEVQVHVDGQPGERCPPSIAPGPGVAHPSPAPVPVSFPGVPLPVVATLRSRARAAGFGFHQDVILVEPDAQADLHDTNLLLLLLLLFLFLLFDWLTLLCLPCTALRFDRLCRLERFGRFGRFGLGLSGGVDDSDRGLPFLGLCHSRVCFPPVWLEQPKRRRVLLAFLADRSVPLFFFFFLQG
mmetsp:Transcript_31649/g.79501  ORF Transcript_31649/g.79501 Transcript_31649/m.79501 type:complete len:243 (+) Transcript_31649:639-1367(+)